MENRLEPHRQSAVEYAAFVVQADLVTSSLALKRHQSLNRLDVQDDDVAIADDTAPAKADPAENAVAVAVN